MKRILLVEDDPLIQRSLTLTLKAEGYATIAAPDLTSARTELKAATPNLCLLDVELPDGSGIDFCAELRVHHPSLPVLILTARLDEESAVQGLSAGANDYIRKPFGKKELVARIRRWLGEKVADAKALRCGPMVLDFDRRTVTVEGKGIDLNRREFEILSVLAQRPGEVVSRQYMLSLIDCEAEIFERTIDSHLSKIRAKLRKAGVPALQINSVYGVGYRLETGTE